jgi:hypothetical protein
VCPAGVLHYLKPWQRGRSATLQHARDEAKPSSFEEFLKRLGGDVFIETFQKLSERPKGVFLFEGQYVESLVWVAKWAPRAFRVCFYLELDCTFRAGRPYVLCIPMAVICNFGVPLGCIFTPTEQADTFTKWAEALKKVDDSCDVKDKPMLSDGGAGLASYARHYCKAHYRCYSHLLVNLGSKSYAAMLAKIICSRPGGRGWSKS